MNLFLQKVMHSTSGNALAGNPEDLRSPDDKYRMELMSASEFDGLTTTVLGNYFLHMAQNPYTLLPRILGFYKYDGPANMDAHYMFYINVLPRDIEPSKPFTFDNKRSKPVS